MEAGDVEVKRLGLDDCPSQIVETEDGYQSSSLRWTNPPTRVAAGFRLGQVSPEALLLVRGPDPHCPSFLQ
jgi:hypothetical protein